MEIWKIAVHVLKTLSWTAARPQNNGQYKFRLVRSTSTEDHKNKNINKYDKLHYDFKHLKCIDMA